MHVRPARLADRPAIRDVARRSLAESYPLDANAITAAVSEWYGERRLERTIERERRLLLVGERDGQVVGLSECLLAGEGLGTLLWLHVDPDHRGDGFGETLYEETRVSLGERGVERLHARVLADNPDGIAFFERRGFEKVGESRVEIDGRAHLECRYVEAAGPGREPIEVDGGSVFVDPAETRIGSAAPFQIVYSDQSGTRQYGYYCTNCDRLANAMDAMGRVRCTDCDNVRKPTRWDAAYL